VSQCCGKIPSNSDIDDIRKSIIDPDPTTVEWIIEFTPPADIVEVKIDETNGIDKIIAKYDQRGYLHIVKVYTEDKVTENETHEKGDTHQTLSFPEQNYRVSQDFDAHGNPIPGTAHITDQNTKTVVWREA